MTVNCFYTDVTCPCPKSQLEGEHVQYVSTMSMTMCSICVFLTCLCSSHLWQLYINIIQYQHLQGSCSIWSFGKMQTRHICWEAGSWNWYLLSVNSAVPEIHMNANICSGWFIWIWKRFSYRNSMNALNQSSIFTVGY